MSRSRWLVLCYVTLLLLPAAAAAQDTSSTLPAGFLSATDAGDAAQKALSLPNFNPAPELDTDSTGKQWYVVNFYRFDSITQKWIWGARIVLDPKTGKRVTNARVLSDFQAASGAVPSNVDPVTHELLMTVSLEDAPVIAARDLGLPLEEASPAALIYDPVDTMWWYSVFFLKKNARGERFFDAAAFVNPYFGGTDAITDLPGGTDALIGMGLTSLGQPSWVDPKTNRVIEDGQDLSTVRYQAFRDALLRPAALGVGVLLFAALAAGVLYVRRKYKLTIADLIFALLIVAQVVFGVITLILDQTTYGLSTGFGLFVTAGGTLTSWIWTRAYLRSMPSPESDAASVAQLRNVNVQKLHWSDLVIPERTLAELKQFVELVRRPEDAKNLGLEPPKGMLLYGPPGTGKTTIAKVLATEAGATFFILTPADIFNKWMGESEQKVKHVFEDARKHTPALIFIDEIDSLMSRRGSDAGYWADKVVNVMLQEIDGMKDSSGVYVVGATNAPNVLDPALLRGGRLSLHIEIPLPEAPQREKLLSLFLKNAKRASDLDLADAARKAEGLSGADIEELCNRLLLKLFSGGEKEVTTALLEDAIAQYHRSSLSSSAPVLGRS